MLSFKMDNSKYFRDIFESIPDYRKIILLKILIKNGSDLLLEIGFSQRDITRLNLEFKNILMEQNEESLDSIKSEEESIIEKILNKQMQIDNNHLSSLFTILKK